MEKKRNLWVIPTDKPSSLFYIDENLFYLPEEKDRTNWNKDLVKCQNIYITNDEYIGLSYYLDGDLVRKGVVDDKDYWEVRKDYKKIILTTDPDLIKDGVQAIDDEFLELFVKHPSCEVVEVYELYGKLYAEPITQKEEPKQETLEEAAERYSRQYSMAFYACYDSYLEGAKWQQDQDKKKYSEEEARAFAYNAFCLGQLDNPTENKFNGWFEQFKKK